MNLEKRIDESWKENAAREKEILKHTNAPKDESSPVSPQKPETDSAWPSSDKTSRGQSDDAESLPDMSQLGDLNFLSYLSSLAFQAMIFLGEIPNPITNEIDKNLEQAKMLIDTLALLREKTKGNLTTQEDHFLSGSIYELQMKYVEIVQKENQA